MAIPPWTHLILSKRVKCGHEDQHSGLLTCLYEKKKNHQTKPTPKLSVIPWDSLNALYLSREIKNLRRISSFQKWTDLWWKFIQPSSTKMGSLQPPPVTSYKWSITFFWYWCLNTTWQVAQKPPCAFTLQKKRYNTSSSLQIRQLKQQG